jgi:hypothetical protein
VNILSNRHNRRHGVALLALLLVVSSSCSKETHAGNSNKSQPLVDTRPGAAGGKNGARPKAGIPRAEERLQPAAANEKEQIAAIVELIKDKGTQRVLVRLESTEFPRIEPPQYDSRAKRSTLTTDGRSGPVLTAQRLYSTAQSRFLQRFAGGDGRRVKAFETVPYLAMDLNLADATSLQSWMQESAPDTPARPFRIWVEADVPLTQQSAPAFESYVTVEDAARYMEFGGLAEAAIPSTVVIIDGPVDHQLNLLHGRIDAIQALSGLTWTDVPLTGPAADPAEYSTYFPSHGTKLALIVAQATPKARIVALDIYGTSTTTSVESIASALEWVLKKKREMPGWKVASVCISTGFETIYSTGDCDCKTEPYYWGCSSLKPLIYDVVNQLAAPEVQVPVVMSAGKYIGYAGVVLYPSCIKTAVTVAATSGGVDGTSAVRCSVSSWGPMLDLCAQGSQLTIKLDQWMSPPGTAIDTYIGSGSSFAAPYVAAAFSALWDAHEDATTLLIDEALRKESFKITYTGIGVPEIRVLTASQWLDQPPPADATLVETTTVADDASVTAVPAGY